MKKEKGLKKFNISNKLAYTLMVVFSIVLLGIGVFAFNYAPSNPSVMGHSANELLLDWGAVSSCTGTATNCEALFTQSACDNQDGCWYGCTGGEFDITCSWFSQWDCSSMSGCYWDSGTNSCTGWAEQTVYCQDLNPSNNCMYYVGSYPVSTPCYEGCSGTPNTCASYSTSACTGQAGCSVTTVQRSITNNSRGINISNLQVSYLCDPSGLNCVRVRAGTTSTAAYFDDGADNARREMRRNAYVSCPAGSYLTRVQIIDGGSGVEAHLEGSCRTLPIQ